MNKEINNKYKILHMNLDNKAPSGTFTLLYSMLDYLPVNYVFDFLGDIEENEYLIKIREKGGEAYNQPDNKNKFKKWKEIEEYSYSLCKKEKYDVVHIASDSSFKAIKYARAARKAGIKKIIVHSHNSNLAGKFMTVKRFYHNIDKYFLPKFCDTYAACSDAAAKWMWTNRIIKQGKVNIIINGIEVERFIFDPIKRERFRSKYKLENKFVIGHISDFGYQKNPDYILSVFREIYKQDTDCVLLLVGSNKFKRDILKKIDKEEYYKNIIDVGALHETENAYCAMDIYIQPSRYEGLPICMIEAAASGLKIIGSNNISSESKILDTTELMPIDISCEIWANKILDYKNKIISNDERIQKGNNLRESLFDIKTTTRHFLDMY